MPQNREETMLAAGYRCTVPTCRALTGLEAHPLGDADDLVCLCAPCSDRYRYEGTPSEQTMTAYKIRLQDMTRALDRESLDLFFYLNKLEWLAVSGDQVARAAPLLNAGYLYADYKNSPHYRLRLTNKGKQFLDSWQSGELD